MPYAVSLVDLQCAGVVLTADEVVAVAQKLIHQPPDAAPRPPFGPLALERIRIGSDGTVACDGCAATPSVAELAILVQDLLARTPHVPGGLHYAIARALHEVDAPPFDSLEEFGATLARYAPARADEGLRRIVARCDRRRPANASADLRVYLREADRRLYESQAKRVTPTAATPEPRRQGWMVAALVAGALTTIAAASVVGDRTLAMPPAPAPPATQPVSAPLAVNDASTVHPVLVARPLARRTHVNPQRPVRDGRAHELRLRWFHRTLTIKDDLTKP